MRACCRFLYASVLVASSLGAGETSTLHHALTVTLVPAEHRITVADTVTAPEGSLVPDLPKGALPVADPRVERKDPRTLVVTYTATIDHPISREGEDYARGFAETEGTIGPEGVFLGGTSRWFPTFGDDRLVAFDLDVSLPPGWEAMSQGRRVARETTAGGTHVRFTCPYPQEEIWLVAGPWIETTHSVEGIEATAMLRAKDETLAGKYLDATGPYVGMYSKLLGPYPYPKFALVENFWETGYGMPSFTLLGPQVIRFPFILTSSYPHEILHNWWGNGVYVNAAGGNWSEGLTAYLADHLFAEQKGGGAAYRQETLQKYADYAARSKDFPLTEFRERHSASTEAVGYGKALMLFHMIRRELGDETFVRGLKAFYADHRFTRASFDDLRRAFEGAASRSLGPVFTPWVVRAGAPRLAVRDVVVTPRGTWWRLTGTIVQTQEGEPYRLSVPLALTIEAHDRAMQSVVTAEGRESPFALDLPARPLRLDVDPEFDLFRVLDREEIPPALSGPFGAEKGVVVLPAGAPAELQAAYRALAEEWNHGRTSPMRIVTDADLRELPRDAAVWLLGFENRLLDAGTKPLAVYGASAGATGIKAAGKELARANHAVVLVVRREDRPDLPLAIVAADRAAQVPGLARKLPHYSKYSYLAFEGDEPTNTLKGRWPVVRSPLTVVFDATRSPAETPMDPLAPRRALAELPPVFSADRMLATVRTLAAPEMKGRGLGTQELDRAAGVIADAMRDAGLEPAGDAAGSYLQSGTGTIAGKEVKLDNVVGAIRGGKPEWAKESVVVAAHYDHLGVGKDGRVHPGADDNASGVAVLLELARQMAAAPPPRTILFVAFSGEESGMLGSKWFVAHRPPSSTTLAMVNLDTVGRLGRGTILVLGISSADEWIHVVNGASYVTGDPVQAVMNDPGGSDQNSFLAAGVPAVQLFTGANADYHAPGDTAEKIDGVGLVKVAAVTREIVGYLAERDRPLTSRLVTKGVPASPAPPAAPGARRASLGGIPDYGFAGPGVRITGTMAGSPAERAGLKEGDVIVGLGEAAVSTLQEFSAALSTHAPGERVKVRFLRSGAKMTADVVLGER